MAANEYALKTIETARANEPSPWSLAANVPWSSRKSTGVIVTETFEEAMNTLSRHLKRLIVEAEVNDKNLNDLEEQLNSLHELVSREDSSISSAKSDLLADLWTVLGGNRKKLRHFDSHLALLKDLTNYRKQAAAHVVAALQTLRGMAHDMEDMRERVAAPDLMGSSVSVETHMRSIEMGLAQMKEGRIRARKLEQEAMLKFLSLSGSEDE
jgi:exonuclease VII large subunit